MWKQLPLLVLVCSPVLSKLLFPDIIGRSVKSLTKTLDYIFAKYGQINADCLLGVVYATVILNDTTAEAGPYRETLEILKTRTQEIYSQALPVMEKDWYWNSYAKYLVDPKILPQHIAYKSSKFKKVYPVKSRALAIFSEGYVGQFSDKCLSSIVNSTLSLKLTTCIFSFECRKYIESVNQGASYALTHKLLLLQIARNRKCTLNAEIVANTIEQGCKRVYEETISAETFLGLEEIFDLFLEQTILCGTEGFTDFLKHKWLEVIFEVQRETGCFPGSVRNRQKREGNTWEDGCVDHTTGLGAAVLSLYLNYMLKNPGLIL